MTMLDRVIIKKE